MPGGRGGLEKAEKDVVIKGQPRNYHVAQLWWWWRNAAAGVMEFHGAKYTCSNECL